MPTKPKPPPLPEQLENEPDAAYSLFAEFCQLGDKRSIRALSELTGRSRSTLGGLSVRWQWPDRAAAWDRSHAIAPEPSPAKVEALGDRRARISVALDAAIDLIADKLASADPVETPARSISGLVSALVSCAELSDSLDPPSITEQFAAIEVLLPAVDPRLADRLATQLGVALETFRGGLDASLSAIDFGDQDEAIDVSIRE